MARRMERYIQPVWASACPWKAPDIYAWGETSDALSSIRCDELELGSVPADVAPLSVAYDTNQSSGPLATATLLAVLLLVIRTTEDTVESCPRFQQEQ